MIIMYVVEIISHNYYLIKMEFCKKTLPCPT